MFKTITDLKEANREAGLHFFDRDTMRFFKSKVESGMYAGRYFITSEQGPHGPRKYTIREARSDAAVIDASNFMQYSDLDDARADARELAKEARALSTK